MAYACCKKQTDGEEEPLWCYGVSHPAAPQKWHSECAQDLEYNDDEFLCETCRRFEDPTQGSSQPNSQTSWEAGLDTQVETYSASEEDTADEEPLDPSESGHVSEVTGADLYEDESTNGTGTSVVHLMLAWSGQDDEGNPWSDTSEPFYMNDRVIFKQESRYFADHVYAMPDDKGSAELRGLDEASRTQYWTILQKGYHNLLRSISKEVLEYHTALHPHYGKDTNSEDALAPFKMDAFQMLASVPFQVLCGLCGSGIRRRKSQSLEMYAWLSKNRIKSVRRPCIYVIEFTDRVGAPPTLRHMIDVVNGCITWFQPNLAKVKEVEFSDKITSRLLKNRPGPFLSAPMSDKFRILLERLGEKLRALQSEGHAYDKPVPFIMRDIGYTADGSKRIAEHERANASANKVLSIFYQVSQDTSKEMKHLNVYKMYGEVVFLSFQAEHASLAECFFSIFAQSYVEYGTGFNTAPAGININGNEAYLSRWPALAGDIVQESPFRVNVLAEKQRIAESRLQRAQLGAKIRELKRSALQKQIDRLKAEIWSNQVMRNLHDLTYGETRE